MDKKSLEKQSQMRDGEWRQALKRGRCPIKGCDITRRTCSHLDSYVAGNTQSVNYISKPYWNNEQVAPLPEPESTTAFDLREKLLLFELSDRQREILIHRFIYQSTYKTIKEEMKFINARVAQKFFKSTIDELKQQGLSLGDTDVKTEK